MITLEKSEGLRSERGAESEGKWSGIGEWEGREDRDSQSTVMVSTYWTKPCCVKYIGFVLKLLRVIFTYFQ